MSVSERVTTFLRQRDVDFDIRAHAPTQTSLQTARAADVPRHRVAKGVLLEDGEQFVMAVIPATQRLDTRALGVLLHRDLRLVPESDMSLLFRDCRPGAVPPLGSAYGIATIVDDALLSRKEVFFEGGDHEHLVRVSGAAFDKLMIGNKHGSFGH